MVQDQETGAGEAVDEFPGARARGQLRDLGATAHRAFLVADIDEVDQRAEERRLKLASASAPSRANSSSARNANAPSTPFNSL